MSDALTTPRKLEQIRWARGITDGDIREGFFSELLNVEMDEPARIRTRDSIVEESVHIPTVEECKFLHLTSDPTSNRPDGWNMFITQGKVFVYPYGYDMTEADAAEIVLPISVDLSSIESVILGSSVIFSSLDPTTGAPNQVTSIVYNSASGKFSPPEYIVDSDYAYAQQDYDGSWGIHVFDRTPTARMWVADEYSSYDKAIRRSYLNQIESFLNSNSENGCAITCIPQPRDIITSYEPGYSGPTACQVVAVFVYADGSVSLPSNIMDVSTEISGYDFDLGFNIFMHEDCFKSIVGVRLYRKILSGRPALSDQYDFLMYAPLFDESVHEDTLRESVSSEGVRVMVVNPDTNNDLPSVDPNEADYYYLANEETFGQRFAEDFVDPTQTREGRVIYGHRIPGDTLNKTAGWIRPRDGSTAVMYMPVHMYQSGALVTSITGLRWEDGLIPERYSWTKTTVVHSNADNIFITDRFNVGDSEREDAYNNVFEVIQNAMIVGSHIAPPVRADWDVNIGGLYGLWALGPNTNDAGATWAASYDKDLIGYRGVFRLSNPDGDGHSVTFSDSSGKLNISITVGNTPSDQEEGFGRTFAAYRDPGKPSPVPTLEEEIGGVNAEDISSVKPRHIGTAGGRLFALNILENSIEQPSKLMYTEFGNFSVFRKDNYIDYGVRDDGRGVAISTLKSYVIAHHTASTYVFDISGGSDFVWREVGAYKDVGCLDPNLIVTTPFGVFWCDRNHMWFYDGRQPIPITGEIINTYRSIVSKIERVLYKESLKQVWLVPNDGGYIYVFDIDGQRWHTHQFTEFNQNTRLHDSIYVVGSDVFLNTVTREFSEHKFYKFTDSGTAPFTWRLDTGKMDMGMPEIIKKIRRLYCHMVRDEAYAAVDRALKIQAIGSTSGNILINDDLVINDEQVRISTSVRGYHVRFIISVEASEFWTGAMESLGVSYKVKKLK